MNRWWPRWTIDLQSGLDMDFADRKCIPCRGGVPPMELDRARELVAELDPGWWLNDAGHLERQFGFGNFVEAMDFANRVTEIAEAENHHPDLHIAWARCVVEIWTHKIQGLTESDFFFAAKADRAFRGDSPEPTNSQPPTSLSS